MRFNYVSEVKSPVYEELVVDNECVASSGFWTCIL